MMFCGSFVNICDRTGLGIILIALPTGVFPSRPPKQTAKRGQLFDEGNYAMFIHWGLYSQLSNKMDGKTYYGIGEWIMHKKMARIPVEEYKRLASTFNPEQFDARAIVKFAKDAGMKYIVITPPQLRASV